LTTAVTMAPARVMANDMTRARSGRRSGRPGIQKIVVFESSWAQRRCAGVPERDGAGEERWSRRTPPRLGEGYQAIDVPAGTSRCRAIPSNGHRAAAMSARRRARPARSSRLRRRRRAHPAQDVTLH
jgi:hypothetical protein